MKRFACIAVILLALAPAAFADSIQFTINSTVHVVGGSPNDNWYGIYETQPDAYGTTSIVNVSVPFVNGSTTFSNVSFFLPTGSVVTAATMTIILPTTPIVGTASVAIAPEGYPLPDLGAGSLHIPPTLNYPATMTLYVEDVLIGFAPPTSFPNTPIISGNEVSTGTWNLSFLTSGDIAATVDTQGYDWAGWITGSGQADIPFSVQVDVDYTVAPEPSSFVLLGTGLIGFIEAVRRRHAA